MSSRHGTALAECLPHLTGKVGQKWLGHQVYMVVDF